MLVVTAALAVWLFAWSTSAYWGPGHSFGCDPRHNRSSNLAEYALQKVLDDASEIFGPYVNFQSNTSRWMKAYPDDTPLVHLNLPGTHDAATWNYSVETQQRLNPVTSLVGIVEYSPDFYRCQERSFIDMLDDGIRVFDLRYAYDVTNDTLVFWHSAALLSETTTIDDALFGYYKWLDDHPSEVVFLSFQYQGSTAPHAQNNAGVQLALYKALTSPAARKYIVQDHSLGTLGETRGKIVLLRRFDLSSLSANYTSSLPGLHFSPNDWTDNGANIILQYNSANGTAYIEDYYQPSTAFNSTLDESIGIKLNATESHLTLAASDSHPDDLFWTFASSTNIIHSPPSTPRIQALGDNSTTASGGVNDQLVDFLPTLKGKRLGIVMFDFYEEPKELLPLFLSLLPPKSHGHKHDEQN